MKIEHARYFVIAATATGALAVTAMLAFLILPTLRDLDDLSKKIVEAETEIRAQYENRKNLLEVLAKLKDTRDAMSKLSGQFIPEGGELSFITGIEGIGDRDGVAVKVTIEPGSPGAKPSTADFERPFSVSISGNFAKVMHALVDVERMPTLNTISNLSVHAAGNDVDGTALVSTTVQGMIAVPLKGL